MKANCVVCGKEFEKRNASKTCSDECRTDRVRVRHAKNQRAQYAANPERHNAKRKVRYVANWGEARASRKAWAIANPEKVKTLYQNWYAANKKEVKKKVLAYKRTRSAARRLFLPPLLYAAMKLSDRLISNPAQSPGGGK